MLTRVGRVWTGAVQPEWKVTVAGAAGDSSASHATTGGAAEHEVVRACLAGDRHAFDLVVERYRRPVYLLCYRFVGNHEDAADLTQEVFLRAYRGLRRFKGRSALSTWLYRIGVNVCLNKVTARRHDTEPLDARQHEDRRSRDPVQSLVQAERAAMIRSAVAKLPARQRATVILRVYHELSHQQIAEILGSSVGSVKANLFHALGNLRKLLAPQPARERR